MSPLYFLIFCAPLAAVAQPRASTDKCPAIAPLSADECPPKEAAMSDCVGYDCRFGCKPYNLEDHGIEDWFPIGTVCEARPNHDAECDIDSDLNNCYGHTGEMDGDFYKVVQGGPKCPFLEFVEECPKTLFNTGELPKCHSDKCLCEGDFCRGKGSSPDFCGATNEKENCDGHAVYKVTSHFYMPREGCDVCGAPPPPLDESCPILKLIDEDTCDYVEDKDDLPLCSDPCLCVGSFCQASKETYCGASKDIRNCDDGGMSIFIVESNPERSESCGFCPAANSECPALVPLDECLPGNPAANDCATDDCIYGCKPDADLGIAEREWYPIGQICEVKAAKGKGECNTDRGLDNCLGHDGEMNGDFYKVVQGGKNCPFLEKAKSCPNDVDDLPPCEDPCLAESDYCVGTGPSAKSCGATDAEPQCSGKAVYLVTSDQDMPREGCGLNEVEDECPFPCPAANDQCPALEPLPAHECPPKEASMADCVGYDCRYGCQPYNLEDHGIEDWYDIGTVCESLSHSGEDDCGTSSKINNCYGHDGEMNGDFYRVVQGGPGCPYLEYVDAERCPDDVSNLPRCEDKCLEGDYCRGGGSGKEFCGASDAKPQCDGEAVYRVTSTIDMAREGCDDGPDDGPGFEFDDDATDCPFPCPARNEECPALEPLPADECPPKEASMKDCVGFDCRFGCKPYNLDDHGISDWYEIGTVCEISSPGPDNSGECGTTRNLNNCYGHTGEMDGDFYKVVQGGPDCPYLEAARCPNDVDDLSPCDAKCLEQGEVCRGTTTDPSPESCGTSEGKCYKVTSTKFMPREGCDGSDAGDDSSDEADCPFPCPAANDACPALEPLPEDECLPGNPAATDCVGHDCIYGCKPKTEEEYGIIEYRPIGTICERKYPLSGDGEGECGTSKSLNNCLGHDGDKDGDFYRVVQGGPGCPYLEKATCPTDGAEANLPPCTDPCLAESDLCQGSGDAPEECGASSGFCFKVTSTIDMAREGCDGTGGSSKKKSSSNDAGLIAGVAIACVAAVLLVAILTYCCCCRRSSSAAKSRSSSRREAPPSPPVPNPVIDKAPSRRAEPDEQLEFQGGELR